ncbi:MAG: hypothetical protein AMXMBFR13_50610 [Phycisphaerae bacterium]
MNQISREKPAETSGSRELCTSSGFTLIEILVVVAIIALLVAVLLPSLARARALTRTVICTTQAQQLMKGHPAVQDGLQGPFAGNRNQ